MAVEGSFDPNKQGDPQHHDNPDDCAHSNDDKTSPPTPEEHLEVEGEQLPASPTFTFGEITPDLRAYTPKPGFTAVSLVRNTGLHTFLPSVYQQPAHSQLVFQNRAYLQSEFDHPAFPQSEFHYAYSQPVYHSNVRALSPITSDSSISGDEHTFTPPSSSEHSPQPSLSSRGHSPPSSLSRAGLSLLEASRLHSMNFQQPSELGGSAIDTGFNRTVLDTPTDAGLTPSATTPRSFHEQLGRSVTRHYATAPPGSLLDYLNSPNCSLTFEDKSEIFTNLARSNITGFDSASGQSDFPSVFERLAAMKGEERASALEYGGDSLGGLCRAFVANLHIQREKESEAALLRQQLEKTTVELKQELVEMKQRMDDLKEKNAVCEEKLEAKKEEMMEELSEKIYTKLHAEFDRRFEAQKEVLIEDTIVALASSNYLRVAIDDVASEKSDKFFAHRKRDVEDEQNDAQRQIAEKDFKIKSLEEDLRDFMSLRQLSADADADAPNDNEMQMNAFVSIVKAVGEKHREVDRFNYLEMKKIKDEVASNRARSERVEEQLKEDVGELKTSLEETKSDLLSTIARLKVNEGAILGEKLCMMALKVRRFLDAIADGVEKLAETKNYKIARADPLDHGQRAIHSWAKAARYIRDHPSDPKCKPFAVMLNEKNFEASFRLVHGKDSRLRAFGNVGGHTGFEIFFLQLQEALDLFCDVTESDIAKVLYDGFVEYIDEEALTKEQVQRSSLEWKRAAVDAPSADATTKRMKTLRDFRELYMRAADPVEPKGDPASLQVLDNLTSPQASSKAAASKSLPSRSSKQEDSKAPMSPPPPPSSSSSKRSKPETSKVPPPKNGSKGPRNPK